MNKITFAFKNIMNQKEGRLAQRWDYDTGSLLLSSPIIDDIDNDGRKEIIFGTKNGKIHAIDIEGKLIWSFDTQEQQTNVELMFLDTENSNSISSTPNIEDINFDGKKEIVFGTESGKLYAVDSKGKILWTFKAQGPIRASPCIQRFANKESAIGFGSNDKNLYVVNSKGKLVWRYTCDAEIESCPAVILAHQPMIVFGANNGMIYALSLKGQLLWKFATKGKILAQAHYEKLSEKSSPVILIGSTDGDLYCLDETGRELWKYHTEGAICSKVVTADIDGDKVKEIVFGSCDNNVYALTSEGKKMWSYETDFWVVASPIITDLDNDGKMEIVAGSYDHNIYVLDSEGTFMLDYVPGVSGIVGQSGNYGEAVTKNPGKTMGKKIWQYKTDGVIVGCAYVAQHLIVNTDSGKISNLRHMKE